MDESTLFDSLPAYVLGTLSDEERAEVESLLATSNEARQELQRYEEMFAVLGTMVPARKAPPRLTDGFRQRLARTKSAQASAQASVPPATPAVRPAVVPAGSRFSATRLLVGLAAVIVLAVALVAVYQQINNGNQQ